MTGDLIFRTQHGSHLYGFEHAGSDYDLYEVYEGKSHTLRQSTDGTLDVVTGTLEAFLLRAASGSHQSVEAIFSESKEWAPGMEEKWGPLIENFRVTDPEAFAKYERTIKKFAFGDYKRRRHACRLAINLGELRETGRITPRLHPVDRVLCSGYAKIYEGHELLDQIREVAIPRDLW